MAASGQQLDLSSIGRPVADKHSTGGVGDKTSLVVHAARRRVRRTGGQDERTRTRFHRRHGSTSSNHSGLRVDLDAATFVRQLRDVGIVISGQSADLAPADGKLYALRDVTGTVRACR